MELKSRPKFIINKQQQINSVVDKMAIHVSKQLLEQITSVISEKVQEEAKNNGIKIDNMNVVSLNYEAEITGNIDETSRARVKKIIYDTINEIDKYTDDDLPFRVLSVESK